MRLFTLIASILVVPMMSMAAGDSQQDDIQRSAKAINLTLTLAKDLDAINDPGVSEMQKRQRLSQLLRERANLQRLLTQLMQTKEWRTADAETQRKFIKVFDDYAAYSLLDYTRTIDFSQFKILGSNATEGNGVMIHSELMDGGGKNIKVDWKYDENMRLSDVIPANLLGATAANHLGSQVTPRLVRGGIESAINLLSSKAYAKN
jgi:ABC-type transporter MlaC component